MEKELIKHFVVVVDDVIVSFNSLFEPLPVDRAVIAIGDLSSFPQNAVIHYLSGLSALTDTQLSENKSYWEEQRIKEVEEKQYE